MAGVVGITAGQVSTPVSKDQGSTQAAVLSHPIRRTRRCRKERNKGDHE